MSAGSLALNLLHLMQRSHDKYIPGVVWISPSANDTFGPGDTIVAKWNMTSGISSPLFRLCMSLENFSGSEGYGLEGRCGSTLSPVVEHGGGSYFVELLAPNVTEYGEYFIVVEDRDGAVTDSPVFHLSPRAPPEVRISSPPPSPHAFFFADVQTTFDVMDLPLHHSLLSTELTTTTTQDTSLLSPQSRQPPVVRFVIPLAIILVILATAAFMSIRYCWQRKATPSDDVETLGPSRQSTIDSVQSTSEVGPNHELLDKIDPGNGASMPIPLFMPVHTRVERNGSMIRPFILSTYSRATSRALPRRDARNFRSLGISHARGPIYPSLPPISISPRPFIEEAESVTTNPGQTLPPPPGLVSVPSVPSSKSS
ncbi:hypothetical protein B0H34DRAFT_793065 [Crassisporium funariophilum]|nr:hypothetical protein B0H34DRAFT_793065 [Crassisporium funariophilum]